MKSFEALTIVAFVIAIIAIGPVLTIMALNTLFNVGIELTIYTWLSVAWIQFLLASMGGVTANKK